MLDPRNKDSVLQFVSRWMVELGELDATFRKADVAALKGFITSFEDVLRPAYAKKADQYQRRTVFCGSVNDTDFLVDSENRRFWCIEVDELDPNHKIDIQQLWAQVYHIWMAGETVDGKVEKRAAHWLPREEAEALALSNKSFESLDPIVEKFDDTFIHPDDAPDADVVRLGATQICEECGIGSPKKVEINKLASVMLQRGFNRRGNDKKFAVVYRDEGAEGIAKRNGGKVEMLKEKFKPVRVG